MQKELIKVYKEIYTSVLNLIPEKWEKIYLYASVMEDLKGEMYYYYFPKKLIKAKPVNCYEIPNKFGLDENTYNDEILQIYLKVKKIRKYLNEPFTNLTMIIDKNTITTEFHYNDLKRSKYSDEQRHIIWEYKYLNTPIDSLEKSSQELIRHYREETNIKPKVYIQEIKNLEKIEIKNPILKV